MCVRMYFLLLPLLALAFPLQATSLIYWLDFLAYMCWSVCCCLVACILIYTSGIVWLISCCVLLFPLHACSNTYPRCYMYIQSTFPDSCRVPHMYTHYIWPLCLQSWASCDPFWTHVAISLNNLSPIWYLMCIRKVTFSSWKKQPHIKCKAWQGGAQAGFQLLLTLWVGALFRAQSTQL